MKSKTYQRKTCEGSIYITIARKEDGTFGSLLITPPSKANNCGCSYAYALQDLLTFSLRRAEGDNELKLILKSISGHYCNAMPPNNNHSKSCPDAISQIIKEEFLAIPAKVIQ
jgi:hypothetical protein